MFIKLGQEKFLSKMRTDGELLFRPCQQFREFEEKQMQKGIGDKNDGGLYAKAITCKISKGEKVILQENVKSGFICEECRYTPMFCITQCEAEYIPKKEYIKLKEQFPNYTHALLIENEQAFLENIRFHFKSRAFAHSVFYQDDFYIDFLQFLLNGKSDIAFYVPKKTKSYYFQACFEDMNGNKTEWVPDKSNVYRTMYKKMKFFENQKEYRVVLPYESWIQEKVCKIEPVESKLVKIEDLIE